MVNTMKIRFLFPVLLFAIILGITACSDEKGGIADDIIVDNAAILTGQDVLLDDFKAYNQKMLEQFDIDFRVVTTANDEDIDLFANRVFSSMQKKSRSTSGKAILLVLNSAQDLLRLEVSMALEPVYTDGFVSYLERKGLVPYFRANKVADAVFVASELIRDRAFEAAEGQEFMESMVSRSIGAGAKTAANTGVFNPDDKAGDMVQLSEGTGPEAVLDSYLTVLQTHNKNPDLEIYSKASREFFRKWTVTDINQGNEYRFITQCKEERKAIYSDDGQYAVLLAPISKRTCCPYFFRQEEGKWRLDIATMAKIIRFNMDMEYHFSMKDKKESAKMYDFAFQGLRYDKNGFPFRQAAAQSSE